MGRFDSGKYTCTAEYVNRGSSGGEVGLTVQYIKTSPADMTVVYGADATLTCVTNLAPDSFKWYVNDECCCDTFFRVSRF